MRRRTSVRSTTGGAQGNERPKQPDPHRDGTLFLRSLNHGANADGAGGAGVSPTLSNELSFPANGRATLRRRCRRSRRRRGSPRATRSTSWSSCGRWDVSAADLLAGLGLGPDDLVDPHLNIPLPTIVDAHRAGARPDRGACSRVLPRPADVGHGARLPGLRGDERADAARGAGARDPVRADPHDVAGAAPRGERIVRRRSSSTSGPTSAQLATSCSSGCSSVSGGSATPCSGGRCPSPPSTSPSPSRTTTLDSGA